MHMATNNLESVRNDPRGARCVHCFGRPDCNSHVNLTDDTTIICNLCGIDAVVPASQVPDEQTLLRWHNLDFKQCTE